MIDWDPIYMNDEGEEQYCDSDESKPMVKVVVAHHC